MHNFLTTAYFQGKFVPFVEANISIATHALHYGTGAFGGLRGIPDPSDANQLAGTELIMKELGAQVIAESEK